MPPITVALLAKELGLSINEVLRLASRCQINVNRGAAMLPPKYADIIRDARRDEIARRQRAAARPRPIASPPPVSPQSADDDSVTAPPVEANPTACVCCGARLPKYGPDEDAGPLAQFCPACSEHYPAHGEDAARRLGRLVEHDERARATYPVLAHEIDNAKERAEQQSRSRNKWRAALVEVMEVHEENPLGGCRCGAKAFPCVNWKTLEQANRGITRQVEEFLAMTDDERDEVLHGDER